MAQLGSRDRDRDHDRRLCFALPLLCKPLHAQQRLNTDHTCTQRGFSFLLIFFLFNFFSTRSLKKGKECEKDSNPTLRPPLSTQTSAGCTLLFSTCACVYVRVLTRKWEQAIAGVLESVSPFTQISTLSIV